MTKEELNKEIAKQEKIELNESLPIIERVKAGTKKVYCISERLKYHFLIKKHEDI